ncbi:hypothetical protein [Pseudomonas sp. BF-R-01]|jgi:hypothetical protein|uniref:hypothetical protein n=1 Tax=Pseudomonas sp. BF-R-01 TaxID=2832365 RepID=UPI001CBD123C|nr:hypothetical protein [Pseudomonas sp. BF-R-01]
MPTTTVNIVLDGLVDDLYALSLLFPKGAHSGFHIATKLTGVKDGLLDREKGTDLFIRAHRKFASAKSNPYRFVA